MSTVICGQSLVSTESATSEYSTTSHLFKCATGPVRESEVYLERPQMEKKITDAPITPIRLLSGDPSPLVIINTAVTRGGEEIHTRGGGGTDPQGPIPLLKKKIQKKEKFQKPTGDSQISSDSGRDSLTLR